MSDDVFERNFYCVFLKKMRGRNIEFRGRKVQSSEQSSHGAILLRSGASLIARNQTQFVIRAQLGGVPLDHFDSVDKTHSTSFGRVRREARNVNSLKHFFRESPSHESYELFAKSVG